MVTRRQVLFTAGSALAATGTVGLGASAGTSSASGADFRVVSPRLIELTPVHDPPTYVRTDDAGRVTAVAPSDEGGVNKRAVTGFDDIVSITNVSTVDITGIRFEFEATSGSLSDETLGEIEAALRVTADGDPLAGGGESGDDLLAVSPAPAVDDGTLGPGESVPFGVQVNLDPNGGSGTLADLPDGDYDLALQVVTTRPED